MPEDRILKIDSDEFARRCVEICHEHKAEQVLLFDMRGKSILADFYILCCGNSEPHLRALAAALHRGVADSGVRSRTEGELASRWLVFDCGVILIHIMDEELRAFYRLEELWGEDNILHIEA